MNFSKSKIEAFVDAWTQGNYSAALENCAPNITFQVEGKSPLAGKYTRDDLVNRLGKQFQELSQGTFKFEAHDLLISDRHATVLGSGKLTKNGKTEEYRTVHVLRHEAGTPVAWYEYPRNLYQFDALWS